MYTGKIRLWSDSNGKELTCSDSVSGTVKLIAGHLSQAKELAETFTDQTSGTDAYLRYDEDIGIPITEAMEVIKHELFSEDMPPIPVKDLGTPIVLANGREVSILRNRLGRPLFETYSRAKEVKSGYSKWEVFSLLVKNEDPHADESYTLIGYIVEAPETMYTTYKDIISDSGVKEYHGI